MTFEVLLPCEEETTAATSGAVASRGEETLAFRGEIVLVVEDEDLLRQGVSRILQKRGFLDLEASNGSVALDVIRAQKGGIDGLVLDITLPGASSREVYEEAKRFEPDLPVIVIRAKGGESAATSLATRVDRVIR